MDRTLKPGIKMPPVRGDRGGIASAILFIYGFWLFAVLFTGYASYHRLYGIRQAAQAALDQATLVAAQQLYPRANLQGQAQINPALAQSAFEATLPVLIGNLPAGSLAGPYRVAVFRVYEGPDVAALPDFAVTGPSVFAELQLPVVVTLYGTPVYRFTLYLATLENTPLWNSQNRAWAD